MASIDVICETKVIDKTQALHCPKMSTQKSIHHKWQKCIIYTFFVNVHKNLSATKNNKIFKFDQITWSFIVQ